MAQGCIYLGGRPQFQREPNTHLPQGLDFACCVFGLQRSVDRALDTEERIPGACTLMCLLSSKRVGNLSMVAKMKAADALKKDWGDFLSANTMDPVRPDEMTSEIMAGETGKSVSRCQRILQELFLTKKATRRRVIRNGAPGYAYKLKP